MYRRRIRRWSAVVGVLVPVVVIAVAGAIFAIPCDGSQCVVRHGPGWGLGALGAPTAVLAGMPWNRGPIVLTITIATSALLWLVIGRWAGRRATRSPVADWRDWRREYWWLVVPVWIGTAMAAVGLAAAVALR